MEAMLQYVKEYHPALTKTLKQLNRKSVAEINAQFVEPQQTFHDYGTVVFTDRDEQNIWKLRFLRMLAQSCFMTYVRKGGLHITKRGDGWLELDAEHKDSITFSGLVRGCKMGFLELLVWRNR